MKLGLTPLDAAVSPVLGHGTTTGGKDVPQHRSSDAQFMTFGNWWNTARIAAGPPNLRFHALRHTGATMAAQSGATLKGLMDRLGHTTPEAALVYQHAAADRDQFIAERLSARLSAAITHES